MPELPSHAEAHGYPQESSDTRGFRAVRKLVCAWGDRHTLGEGLLWTAYPDDYKASTGAIARGYSVDHVPAKQEGAAAIAAYEKAYVTVDYDSYRGESVEGEFISESLEPTAEFLTLDPTKYKWSDGMLLEEGEAPGFLTRGLDYVLTRYRVTTLHADYVNLVGYVNTGSVSPRTTGLGSLVFPVKTLLYNPPTISRVITTGGAKAWTITVRFTLKPQGWNMFWRASANVWSVIYPKAGGAAVVLYPDASFNNLLGISEP